MCDKIKSMKANEQIVGMFGNMARVMNQQMNTLDAVQMSQSM